MLDLWIYIDKEQLVVRTNAKTMNLCSLDDFAFSSYFVRHGKLPSGNNYLKGKFLFLSIYTSEKEQLQLKPKPDRMLVSRNPCKKN